MQTRNFSSADDFARYEEYVVKDLKEAGATLKALDPSGTADDFAMTQEFIKVRMAAYVRSARHVFNELETTTTTHDGSTADRFVENIRKLLDAAAQPLTVLDDCATAAQIEERFKAGRRRLCLQKARHDFDELETSTCAAWGSLTEGMISRIRENVLQAGKSVAALDSSGASSDADIEKRFTAADTRLKLLNIQKEFTEAENATDCYTIFGAFHHRETITKMLDALRTTMPDITLAAADPAGKATVAEVEARLAQAEKRLCRLGALGAVKKLEKYLDGTDKPYHGAMQHQLRELDAYLAHIGGQAALEPAGSEAAASYGRIISRACFKACGEELEDFEKMQTPKTLKEIDARAGRVADLFNRAGMGPIAGVAAEDNPVLTLQERLDEAGARARGLYYAAGGKMPVMKRIRLAAPQGGAA
ncbi:MAG: hypothetical protein ACAH80_00170 [Alphaproteobacteria bacterium]